MAGKAYSRAERQTMIIQTLAIDVQHGRPPRCTVASMARRLGLEPSTHLRKIMGEMVEQGRLWAVSVYHRENRDKVIYSLPPGSYKEPRGRTVSLKLNGRNVGELELFE